MKQRPYRYLWNHFLLWLKHSWSFVWLAVFAGYLMISAGNAIYRNYQSQQETNSLVKELHQSQIEKERLQALLVYYKTDSYKEKELRSTLLLKKPNEKMYALPESSTPRSLEEDLPLASSNDPKKTSTKPIWGQWLDYLTGRTV